MLVCHADDHFIILKTLVPLTAWMINKQKLKKNPTEKHKQPLTTLNRPQNLNQKTTLLYTHIEASCKIAYFNHWRKLQNKLTNIYPNPAFFSSFLTIWWHISLLYFYFKYIPLWFVWTYILFLLSAWCWRRIFLRGKFGRTWRFWPAENPNIGADVRGRPLWNDFAIQKYIRPRVEHVQYGSLCMSSCILYIYISLSFTALRLLPPIVIWWNTSLCSELLKLLCYIFIYIHSHTLRAYYIHTCALSNYEDMERAQNTPN